MGKKNVVFTNVRIIVLVVLVIPFVFLMSIRSEFTKHLNTKYTEQSFKVGFTKIDPIYGHYYANVTCLNDETSFPISKGFKTKKIDDDYIYYKSRNQYNSKIKKAFDDSNVQKNIRSVTGGGKIPFENSASYEQVSIYLISDQVKAAKEVLQILKEKNIYAEKVIFTYEKDKHVYELHLSSTDYKLTEEEIELSIIKIK
jgi:hypothetical protein